MWDCTLDSACVFLHSGNPHKPQASLIHYSSSEVKLISEIQIKIKLIWSCPIPFLQLNSSWIKRGVHVDIILLPVLGDPSFNFIHNAAIISESTDNDMLLVSWQKTKPT